MRIFHSLGHVVGGSLLIAGTTVGVGMLALPIATGPAGFIPTLITYMICWVFMLCTGLLLVEVSLWMPKNTSFISMADRILGPLGRNIFWIAYLFLFTTVMVAHAAGGGSVLLDITGWQIPNWLAIVLYSIVFVPIIYLGAHTVDRINLFLISGVVISYFAFIFISAKFVNFELLKTANWGKIWYAFPVLTAAFTYQVIIPTLVDYMDRNVKKIRLSIFLGTAIPLVIYLVWELLILGIIPLPDLIVAAKEGQNAVVPLKEIIPQVFSIGKYFAFFALTTSFVPLALSFFDFLADGLKWQKKGVHRIGLCAIIFGIPMAIAIAYPHIFLIALSYAGGISCAFLFGFMPPLLVWIGKYVKGYPREQAHFISKKPVLLGLMSFGFLILVGQIVQQVL